MMKNRLFAFPFLAWSAVSFAQETTMPPHPMSMDRGMTTPNEEMPQALRAIVRKVDQNGARVMLSHDPLPQMHMSGMTMYFSVSAPNQLKTLKPGMKVWVSFSKRGEQVIVEKITAAE